MLLKTQTLIDDSKTKEIGKAKNSLSFAKTVFFLTIYFRKKYLLYLNITFNSNNHGINF